MKKMIGLLVLLFAIYFGLQLFFVFFGKGHDIEYKLIDDKREFLINEKYSSNGKDEDNYLLTINVEDTEFNYLTYTDFNKSSQILKDIRYFEDEKYKCIFMKFRNELILSDALCHNGETIIPYNSIEYPSVALQQSVSNLSDFGYSANDWVDDKEIVEAYISMILYSNNLVNDHHVSIAENKDLYSLKGDGTISHKNIFSDSQDAVHAFVDNKYIAYIKNNKKSGFEIYPLPSGTQSEISTNVNFGQIYVLGSYGKSLYFYDTISSIQYELDLDSKKLLQVASTGSKIKYYEGGEWKYSDIGNYNILKSDFGSEYVSDYSSQIYSKIVKRGFDTGYYYGFKNTSRGIEVYRSIYKNMECPTYLFRTDNIDSLKFVGDYIYYMNSNVINYYSDKTGNRTLLYFDGLDKQSIYNVFEIETK